MRYPRWRYQSQTPPINPNSSRFNVHTIPIQVLVQRITSPIVRARIRPASSGAVVSKIFTEGVIVKVTKSARFHIDVDGGFDERDTGPSYHGAPMHAFAVFANPFLATPSTDDPHVLVIRPRDWGAVRSPLSSKPAPGTVVVFSSGEHRPNGTWPHVGVYPGVSYFLSHGAIVYAALVGFSKWIHGSATITGYGVLSGEVLSMLCSTAMRSTVCSTAVVQSVCSATTVM